MNTPLTPRQTDILRAIRQGAPDGRMLTLRLDLHGTLDVERLSLAVARTAALLDATGCVPDPGSDSDVLMRGGNSFTGLYVVGPGAPPPQGETFHASLRIDDPDHACLTLCISPLTCDRNGLALIARRIASVYAGDAPAEEEIGLFAYMQWQDSLRAAPEATVGTAYWRAIAAMPPSSRPRTAALRGEHAMLARDVPARIVERLSALALPIDVAMQTGWWTMIARSDAIIAGPAFWQHDARRDHAPLRDLIGPLDDRLPLAIRPEVGEATGAFIRRVVEQLDGHRAQQEYRPVVADEDGQDAIGFALCEDWNDVMAGDVRWTAVDQPGPHPWFTIALDVVSANGVPVRVDLHHDASRSGEAEAALLLDRYLAVLDALPDHEVSPLAALPILTAREERLHAALAAPHPVRDVRTVPDLLTHWARNRPLSPALEENDNVRTYGELDADTRLLAGHLAAAGIGMGDRVALILPRSASLIIALLAVLRAGAAFIPVDPDWPEARRAAVLDQASPALVWDDQAVTGILRGSVPFTSPIPPSPASVDVAYILFTSGSTGVPKGVIVEHGQLASYVAAARDELDLARCGRFALTSTVAADLGHTCLFGAIAVGGTIVVASADDMADGEAFSRFIASSKIDCVKITPSHLGALLETAEPRLPGTIVLGGEPLPRRLVETIRAISPGTRIFNHYGPTETTVGVMINPVPVAGACPDMLPLDRPLPGCRILLRDAAFAPTPVGEVGEVYIGGPQVARGYLGHPTHPAFIDDPERPDERLYRTGDLARLNANGSLTLAGRRDDQVKIRGFRIELAEVEAALLDLPDIGQAAAAIQGDGDGRQLIAYVVPRASAVIDPKAALGSLGESLPGPAIPSTIIVVSNLPRLANGKIDRQALLTPPMAPAEILADNIGDPLEALIVELVEQLLDRTGIGRTDNIFDIGAHSLIVIKLAARLRKRLEIAVPPSLIFDHPSAAALAERLHDDGVTSDNLVVAA